MGHHRESQPEPRIPHINLVEQNLRSELHRRQGRRAHAQLLIAPEARTHQIEAAYRRLARQFDPRAFRPFGAESVSLAQEIVDLLSAARDEMLGVERAATPPSGAPLPERTRRALETLRAVIARRKLEASRLLDAGRTREAVCCFEAVLQLDPQDAFARAQLATLRAAPSWWERLLTKRS